MARTAIRGLLVGLLGLVLLAGVATSTPGTRLASGQPQATPEASLSPRDPIAEWVSLRMDSMTVEDKVRSLFIHHVAGQSPDAMRELVTPQTLGGFGAGGYILMGDNVWPDVGSMASNLAVGVAEADLPPIVAIDEEGGQVQRLSFDTFAGADSLRDAPADATRTAFHDRAHLLALLGINVNFGIVADVTSDTGSFIYDRTLGDDPSSASERVAAAVGGETSLVGSTLKHFPGHGRTSADSHFGVPSTGVSYDEWAATDALPFQSGIGAGAAFVMFGHLAYTAVDGQPASLSPEWHRILREEMGFEGIAITDDLRMLQDSGDPSLADPYANVVRALNAGNDALLYVLPADSASVGIDREALVHTLVAAVESGVVSEDRLNEATSRLLTFRRSLVPEAKNWVPPCDVSCILRAV